MKLLSFPIIGLLALLPGIGLRAEAVPRERLLMDAGWKFHVGDDWGIAQNLAKAGSGFGPAGFSFGDAGWREVNLPHDWAIELPFDRRADSSHGFRALGAAFPENSRAWYRRHFSLPAADAQRRIWLEMDGVYRDSTVFVNGWFVGRHESGYSGVRYDITDVVNCGGDNVVAVHVDASQSEGWFYEGAGIYRHVWLVKTNPVAIAPDGVFVYSQFKDEHSSGPAAIHLQARVRNMHRQSQEVEVAWEIRSAAGQTMARARQSANLPAMETANLGQTTEIASPELWSPELPRLYQLVTTLRSAGQIIDQTVTEFGVRSFGFDPERGFLLNGQPYQLKGTCNHQDHAGVGAALPDRLQYFRIAKLKELGANAYRSAHNPPTPELLEACDRLGMLVMDENRLVGGDTMHLRWLEEQVRRDRNHACVAIWSLGNEEFSVQGTPAGGRSVAAMQDLVKHLDPTRPVTCNASVGNDFSGINSVIEVRGWSYHIGSANMDAYHAAHSRQSNVGSEQGSTVGTRGIYFKDPARGYVTAYDDNGQEWSNTAEQWVSFFASRPWLSGGFVWTGFDYRGEPTPYSWPCINSHFGIFDTCGFPKDNFWFYRSWWTIQPVLHLLPHWNWKGREGQGIDVRAQSNCDQVELFLNGTSLGRKVMPRQSELKWLVPYAAGTLSAKGYQSGRLVAETKVETTEEPTAILLTADRQQIDANGEDLAVVTVTVSDKAGRTVPTANLPVRFELKGPGRIIGVGNGDPSCHEPDVYFSAPSLSETSIDHWCFKETNVYAEELPEVGADYDATGWSPTVVTGETGQLPAQARAVFRAKFTVTDQMLSAPDAELWFGKLEGDAKVYLNGKLLGPGGDASAPSIYAVKGRPDPGLNTLAIAVANFGDHAGLSKGVSLRLAQPPPAVEWSRSTFNGLAQVIVQSSRLGGQIKLRALADGFHVTDLTIETRSVALRPTQP